MLTGISGVMVQMALEQAVSEITDYLKDIDAKLDDLLRDQKDQTVSKLAGISHMIDETMLIYQQVGSISETTWSKVSSAHKTSLPSRHMRSPRSRDSPKSRT